MSNIIFEQDKRFNITKAPEKDTDWVYSSIIKTSSDIPKSYSLEKYLPPIKHQGDTGFCHSYSAASLKEAQEYQETGYFQILSSLYLAKNIKEIDGIVHTEGTTMDVVCKALHKTGTIPEVDYPSNKYITGSFNFPQIDNVKDIPHYKVKNYVRCTSPDEIKQAISNGKLVLLGIQCLRGIHDVYDRTKVPSIQFDPNGKLIVIGGHQVLAYAYDEDYIYFLNSWGENWGYYGRAKLPISYLTFAPKDFYFSFFIDAYAFVDLKNDKLIGDKVELTINSTSVVVNNRPLILDTAPYIDSKSNRCLVPVRFISEILGYDVKWDDKVKQVEVIKDKTKIVLQIGNGSALINGETVILDQPPVIKNNRTFVPIRFIAETLGCSVLWDNVLQKITILK